MLIQILRRLVQLGVIAWIAAVALLSLYAHYRSARVVDDEVLMSGLKGEIVTQAIHPYVERLEDPESFLDSHKGTLWSMRLFGVSVSDPLAALEAVAATRQIHWPLVSSILIPVLATLILGKVFCSWLCPGYVLFEAAGKLRRLLRIAEIRPATVRFSHQNKYTFLVVGLALAAIFGAPLFALIYPPAVISRAVHAWIFGTQLAGMLVLLVVIVLLEVFISPRWWCQTICPGGALYAILGKFRLLRVKLDRKDCTGCQECIPVCEAGINPITHSESIECDNCGVCLNHCGPGALSYTFDLPAAFQRSNKRKTQRSLRGPKLGTLVLVGLPFLWVQDARAHHVLGLPHYSYKENYPQRPTLEYPATSGPYDILLTSYPGDPVPGEPANLAFYIKNRNTGGVYQDPVDVRVLMTSTFGDNTVILEPTTYAPFDNQHKFQCTFPEDGEYVIELSVMIEGRLEVIPFLLVAGTPTATASLFVAGGGIVLLAFVVLRAVYIKRRRGSRSMTPGDKTNAALRANMPGESRCSG